MNRERAETYLRLLTETELRDPALIWPPTPRAVDAPFVTAPITVIRAAWALTAVGALDLETAEAILADAELAVATRRRPEAAAAGAAGPRLGPRRFAGGRPLARMSHLMPSVPALFPAETARADTASPQGPDRYVPVAQMILFHDELISGELDLMAYAHTATGARFTATWRTRDPLGARHHGVPPVGAFALTDDRGQPYNLVFATKGRPESTCDLILDPEPPPDIGWLKITAPGEQAVRVDLGRRAERPEPQVSEISVSIGEHLLYRIAERLLALAPEYRVNWHLEVAGTPPDPPVTNLAAGLGATIAALEAAEALSALSPAPARLAAVCASLRIGGHGITAAPAPDLPEPWLSMLTHYHRRKPETAPAGDGFAGMAAALPELEGIRLVLLGLHNYDGGTWMDALALGQAPGLQHRALGLDMAFPLSMWVRDGTGRWHAARPSGWYHEDGEAALTLRLTPPLTRSCAWIEVLATGLSAQVRAPVPLCWGYSL
ncbi:MAG: hypothetical protein ACRDP5_25920 [Streptosporangiaceae bacterium]